MKRLRWSLFFSPFCLSKYYRKTPKFWISVKKLMSSVILQFSQGLVKPRAVLLIYSYNIIPRYLNYISKLNAEKVTDRVGARGPVSSSRALGLTLWKFGNEVFFFLLWKTLRECEFAKNSLKISHKKLIFV